MDESRRHSVASPRIWWTAIALIVVSGLGLRFGFVASFDFTGFRQYGTPCQGSANFPGCMPFYEHEMAIGIGGDALYYHDQAHLILEGHMFIDPVAYYARHVVRPSASHPPLYTLTLVGEDLIGLTTVDDQRMGGCVIGAASILVIALIVRRIAGERPAVVAALIAALYPGMWIYDGSEMSESLSILVVSSLLLAALRFREEPGIARAGVVGVLAALAAFTRSELVLLVLFLVVPLVLFVPVRAFRWRSLGAAALAFAVVLAPWLGFNVFRFAHPELLSTQFGETIAVSNCRPVYYGPLTGFWDAPHCLTQRLGKGIKPVPRSTDESVKDAYWRDIGLSYMRSHLSRVLPVIAAREGRVWWLFQPSQQARLNAFVEQWDLGAAELFRWSSYPLVLLAIAGAFLIRREHGVPAFVFLAPVGVTVVAVFLTYGTTRFQAAAEPSIIVLATVTLTSLVAHLVGKTPEEATPAEFTTHEGSDALGTDTFR